jgi:hypothetical protein
MLCVARAVTWSACNTVTVSIDSPKHGALSISKVRPGFAPAVGRGSSQWRASRRLICSATVRMLVSCLSVAC